MQPRVTDEQAKAMLELLRSQNYSGVADLGEEQIADRTDMLAEIERLRKALQIVAMWELPATGKTYIGSNGKQHGVPYECEYGSNGSRDYMKGIARAALEATNAKP